MRQPTPKSDRLLAPLLLQVGACETLLEDALRLAKVAGAAQCESICRSGRRWSICGTY
jgi:hypothetical protein